MFFTKYIKNNFILNWIMIVLSNTVIVFSKLFNFYPKNSDKENIVVIALHRLGDSVFTIPALRNIVNYHGDKIYLICFPETEPIFRIAFNSLNYIHIEHNDIHFDNRIAGRKAKKILKSLRPSTIYDLTGTIVSATLLFGSSAKNIIGINEPFYKAIYSKYNEIRKEPHLMDKYIDAIKNILPVTVTSYYNGENNLSGKYILIHPFTSLEEKEWGLKKYISLAEHLNSIYKCVIVAPSNKIPADIVSELNQKKIDFIETKSVSELIELMKLCSIFIGNDSGPTNIANLLGKPTFTIYGPTNPDFHKPKEGLNDFIIKKRICSPNFDEKMCFTQTKLKGCPAFECMNNLTLDEVKLKVMNFITSVENHKQNLIKN